MPILTTSTTFLKSYLFRLVIRNEATTASSCAVDPFTGTLWLGRAHSSERRVWAQLLDGNPPIDIELLHKDKTVARTIRVQYDDIDWQPIHLDALTNEVAMEWVGLEGARYSLVDVPPKDGEPRMRRQRCLKIHGLPDDARPQRMAMEDGVLIVAVEHDSFEPVADGDPRPCMEFHQVEPYVPNIGACEYYDSAWEQDGCPNSAIDDCMTCGIAICKEHAIDLQSQASASPVHKCPSCDKIG